jgi:hypothetical protein
MLSNGFRLASLWNHPQAKSVNLELDTIIGGTTDLADSEQIVQVTKLLLN